MTRRHIRENVIKLLYLSDFHEKEELDEQLELYFELFVPATAEDKNVILTRYNSVTEKLGIIDQIISNATIGWNINRIGKLELNILRVAVFEIKFDEDVPDKVAINEAIEIGKTYGGEDASYGFINGILAKIIK